MTVDQITSMVKSQIAGISQTASADAVIRSVVQSALPRVNNIGGIMSAGSTIDVSSMTPAQIASLTASEADAIGETQNANEQLSEAVARTSQSIHEIGGKTIIVSVKQTEGISI